MTLANKFILVAIAFALGLRHGFDLDHLSAIDSIIRNVVLHKRLMQRVGLLFSFGHGLVIMLITLIMSIGMLSWQAPEWLRNFGEWFSIIFLLIFSSLTLWTILKEKNYPYLPVYSIKKIFLEKIINKITHPLAIVCVGAFFAVSFDTVTQVTVLSLTGVKEGGAFLVLLGFFFTMGMMLSDGLNGYFVSRIINQYQQKSVIISRVLGFLIVIFGFTIAVINILSFV